MDEIEFNKWLIYIKKQDKSSAQSRVSNCKRVEKFEGDLDLAFSIDGLNSLILKLVFTKDDLDHNRPLKHKVPINGDRYTGTATLKQAITLYQDFKEFATRSDSNSIIAQSASVIPKLNTNGSSIEKTIIPKQPLFETNKTTDIENWKIPEDDVLHKLAQLSTPYIRFLDKRIIAMIVEDNERNREKWIGLLEKKSKDLSKSYLWEKSPCCFPGIRRRTGNSDKDFKLRKFDLQINFAFMVDDNSFPKQIWSFVLEGKKFKNRGPDGYSLAHLIDHKEYKNNFHDLIDGELDIVNYWGLFTCLTNTVYIPNIMIRPTDFANNFLILITRKCYEYYSEVCNIIPKGRSLILTEYFEQLANRKFLLVYARSTK